MPVVRQTDRWTVFGSHTGTPTRDSYVTTAEQKKTFCVRSGFFFFPFFLSCKLLFQIELKKIGLYSQPKAMKISTNLILTPLKKKKADNYLTWIGLELNDKFSGSQFQSTQENSIKSDGEIVLNFLVAQNTKITNHLRKQYTIQCWARLTQWSFGPVRFIHGCMAPILASLRNTPGQKPWESTVENGQ